MSVFNRIAGTEDPKLPVWPIMMDFTRVMDAELSFEDLAKNYELSPAEQAEVGEYLTAIGTLVQAEVATRLTMGWPQESAIRDARVSVDAVLRYALLRTEQQTLTEEQFRTSLGSR